jgi:hypothetical protein
MKSFNSLKSFVLISILFCSITVSAISNPQVNYKDIVDFTKNVSTYNSSKYDNNITSNQKYLGICIILVILAFLVYLIIKLNINITG